MASFGFAPVAAADALRSRPTNTHDGAVEAQTDAEEKWSSHRRLGARLRMVRKNAGLSQTEAAQMFGLSYQQWQKYETGQNRISAVTLHRLACSLNVDVGQFLAVLDGDAIDCANQGGSCSQQAKQLVALLYMLRQTDREMLLALATNLAGKRTDVKRGVPCAVAPPADQTLAPRLARAAASLRSRH